MTDFKILSRPGYFGRKRDEKHAQFNAKWGTGNWTLIWHVPDHGKHEFKDACKNFYEESYFRYFKDRPEDVDFACTYGECIDNAPTNVESGMDYTKQEAFSTHIQDIALRNVLHRLGRKFEGPKDKILVIRSKDTDGIRFGPGEVPFMNPEWIEQPSLCPKWATAGSVEDFWQSNKFLAIKKDQLTLI